jgi:hypothetical protein
MALSDVGSRMALHVRVGWRAVCWVLARDCKVPGRVRPSMALSDMRSRVALAPLSHSCGRVIVRILRLGGIIV